MIVAQTFPPREPEPLPDHPSQGDASGRYLVHGQATNLLIDNYGVSLIRKYSGPGCAFIRLSRAYVFVNVARVLRPRSRAARSRATAQRSGKRDPASSGDISSDAPGLGIRQRVSAERLPLSAMRGER